MCGEKNRKRREAALSFFCPLLPRMSLQDWYNDIPPITRVLFTSSFACTLLPSFGFLSAYNLILSYQSAVQGFEVGSFIQWITF